MTGVALHCSRTVLPLISVWRFGYFRFCSSEQANEVSLRRSVCVPELPWLMFSVWFTVIVTGPSWVLRKESMKMSLCWWSGDVVCDGYRRSSISTLEESVVFWSLETDQLLDVFDAFREELLVFSRFKDGDDFCADEFKFNEELLTLLGHSDVCSGRCIVLPSGDCCSKRLEAASMLSDPFSLSGVFVVPWVWDTQSRLFSACCVLCSVIWDSTKVVSFASIQKGTQQKYSWHVFEWFRANDLACWHMGQFTLVHRCVCLNISFVFTHSENGQLGSEQSKACSTNCSKCCGDTARGFSSLSDLISWSAILGLNIKPTKYKINRTLLGKYTALTSRSGRTQWVRW